MRKWSLSMHRMPFPLHWSTSFPSHICGLGSCSSLCFSLSNNAVCDFPLALVNYLSFYALSFPSELVGNHCFSDFSGGVMTPKGMVSKFSCRDHKLSKPSKRKFVCLSVCFLESLRCLRGADPACVCCELRDILVQET